MFDIRSPSQRMGLIGSDVRRALMASYASARQKRDEDLFVADLSHRLANGLGVPEAALYPFEPDDFNVLEFTYYEDENICYDDCGFPVFNLFEYITPGQYHLFKQDRLDIVVPSIINGLWVSLTYMKEAEVNDECPF